MEKVSNRKQLILDVIDEQIETLEERLAKVQPLIDELNTLRRTRAALLDERRATGGAGRTSAVLTMETVIHDLKTNGPSTPMDVASRLGVSDNTVRSHFNRHADVRYRKNGQGMWSLIGEQDDDEEE